MKKLAVALILIIAVLGGGYFAVTNLLPRNDTKESSTQQDVKTLKATVVLNFGEEEKPSTYSLNLEEGKTALDATKKVTDVVTSGEGEMAFVTSINDREADASKNEFWELVINGEPAQVGAGSYEIKDGDKIEWRVSTF